MTIPQSDYDACWSELSTLMFLTLSKGKFAVIDIIDAPRIAVHKWSMCKGYACRYEPAAVRNGKRPRINMHHVVHPPTDGLWIDHINGMPADNRRKNLRVATRSQNIMNQRPRGASGFKGVYASTKTAGRFEARMRIGGRIKCIGWFEDAESAARAYDAAALKHRGEWAVLNFESSRPLVGQAEAVGK